MSEDALAERMRRLGIRDVDLEETFARSRGPGGQNVNQDSRSQAMNRKLARERLLDAIESAREERRAAEIAEREKMYRRKSPRPPALKRKILEEKRKRGELKKQRAKIEI